MQTIQIRLTKELVRKAQSLVDSDLYSNKSEVIRDALRRLVLNDKLILNEKEFKLIFTADLHGNIVQFEKLFKEGYRTKADAIIIGGDIAPKDPEHRTIKLQKDFLIKKLIPIIEDFNIKNNNRNHKCSVYFMMGNDDFKSNCSVLKKYEKKAGFKLIHNRVIKLHEDFRIIGYAYVPLTPFVYKDWEKLDLNNENEYKKRKDFLIEGKKSQGNRFVEFKFNLQNRKKTIEKDLNNLLGNCVPKKTVLITHSPPYNTKLDMIGKGIHVGSAAVRKIIEKKQLLVTLHGHIHETVKISGAYEDRIGKTVCLAPGNNHIGKSLAIIKIDLYNLKKIKREII